MIINWHRIINSVINYVTVHIFLHLICLPIIIAWGLPSSWLSPLGNFLFTPLLSLFLFFSSLIFFSELMGIPHALCSWVLEWIATCWNWLLTLAPSNNLYGFSSVSWFLLSGIALITFISMMHPLMRNPRYRLCGLLVWFVFSMLLLHAHKPSSCIKTIACHRGTITVIRTHNQTIVIDPGYFGSRISSNNWISYTFMPELIAITGSLTIDHLIIMKLNTSTCTALDTLLYDAQVHHVYMPYMQGNMAGSFAHAFNALYAHIKTSNITLSRFLHDPTCITLENAAFTIQRYATGTYQKMRYPHLLLEGNAHGQNICIKGK